MILLIFERDNLSFKLLDVIELKQSDVHLFNSGRNFDALSFRFRADTEIKTEDRSLHIKDNSVCFFPAHLDYTRNSTVDEFIVIHFNSFDYFSKSIAFFYPPKPEEIAPLFREILDCWTKKETGYRYRCTALLYTIFAKIREQYPAPSRYDPRIEKGVLYIKENFTRVDLSVTDAAEVCNISEVYFRKLFKKQFGVSPKTYIINARIKYAVNLIESGYYSLSEIAEMCGFEDYKYFSSQFHRIKGVPPSKYSYNYKE